MFPLYTVATLVLYKTERLSLGTLLALYAIQYTGILVLFLIKRDREPRRDISKAVSYTHLDVYKRQVHQLFHALASLRGQRLLVVLLQRPNHLAKSGSQDVYKRQGIINSTVIYVVKKGELLQ